MPTIVDGDYEWNAEKSVSNEQKHGVTFEEAAAALDADPNEVAVEDPTEPGRVHSLVMSLRKPRVLLVVTTEAGSRDRIITARKATPDEQRIYQAGS